MKAKKAKKITRKFAALLRAQGDPSATTRKVDTNLSKPGFIVTCRDCGTQAKSKTKPPENIATLCPKCSKKRLKRMRSA